MLRALSFAGAAVGAMLLGGCTINLGPEGPERHDARTIELDKSEAVDTEIHMGVGQLRARGGSSNLLDADFTFRRLSSRPEVRYDGGGVRGRLNIGQPSHHNGGHNVWNLRFNDDKPMDMAIHFGVGEARLDFGDLNLRSLEIHMGVGQVRLDLRGSQPPRKDYSVTIQGGVGQATVYLPDNVGIVAEAHGGIGGIRPGHLRKREDGDYVNDAYGRAKTTVHFNIRGGIGEIELIGG